MAWLYDLDIEDAWLLASWVYTVRLLADESDHKSTSEYDRYHTMMHTFS